ncbi:hypothetical protein Bhyg_04220 [Pseudolycoriella hygida]|uniref:Uncharacterized protein n=1 Tax=Pseudolycoriella hygida TaxID=35572 RepID=A0A9Q0NF01_9DIPT|nr:hypothetical protein Bhyg_04220 [Pseudolycoriella hygida]
MYQIEIVTEKEQQRISPENVGHIDKKEVYRFVKEASDDRFLAMKVAPIIGVFGSCRRAELKDMSLSQMKFFDSCLYITLPRTKTDIIRQFVVGEGDDPDGKYAELRETNMENDRFFVAYRKGKCFRQQIGIHSIAGYPKIIATFLRSPESDMRRYCGWVNESMAGRYIKMSLNNKKKLLTKF